MTCIVAYKKDNKIYMGGDSAASDGNHIFTRKDSKVFIKDEMLFGFTTSFRMGSLIKYKFDIPVKPSRMSVEVYMNTLFIDSLIECFNHGGFMQIDANVIQGGQFIVGYKKRIFYIDSDFQVGEPLNPYYACGSGSETAMGSVSALLKYDRNIKPEKLITLALESATENIESVRGPYLVLSL